LFFYLKKIIFLGPEYHILKKREYMLGLLDPTNNVC